MTFEVEFRPEAFADVAEAFSYYEARGSGLGRDFESELGHTLELVAEMAEIGPKVYRGLRRVLMRRRFPFAVYYRLEKDLVEVRGVIHTSRDPRVWKGRA